MRLDHYILWFERVQASVAKEAIRCNGHLTGTGFDVASVALAGVRLAVGTLLRDIPGGYPDPKWDVATIHFRDPSGAEIEPTWLTFHLEPHPSCQPPRGH